MEEKKLGEPVEIKRKPYRYPEKQKEYHRRTYNGENRERQLAYKKEWYKKKTMYFNHIRSIYLAGYKLRSKGNNFKRKFHDGGKLILHIDGKNYDSKAFYECFDCVKEKCLFKQHEYTIDEDGVMTIQVDSSVLQEKESIMI